MGRKLLVTALALLGFVCAAGVGFAAYLVSRDSVAVPVTRLQPTPRELAPRPSRRPVRQRPPATRPAPPPPPAPVTTIDDHGGRGGSSGRGGGGHGGDD